MAELNTERQSGRQSGGQRAWERRPNWIVGDRKPGFKGLFLFLVLPRLLSMKPAFSRKASFVKLILPILMLIPPMHAATSFPEPAALPVQTNLPDPLVMLNGAKISSSDDWFRKRRPELRELFQHYMYGSMPKALKLEVSRGHVDKNFYGGKATKKQITLSFGSPGAPKINVLLVIPNVRRDPAPVFVGLNFCGNHALVTDTNVPLPEKWMYPNNPGVINNKATEAGRGSQIDVWALEQTIDRGYALAAFYSGDVEPDHPDAPDGLRAWLRQSGSKGEIVADESSQTGTIAAWAWGISRVVDYLITDSDIDSKRIAAVGHSRNGKAAAVAAAFDDRIALSIPHQAGCGGTSPSRGKAGESVKAINDHFPHWFDGNFKKFNDQPERLPFDQNCLITLIAPRPVLLSNAVDDPWANPAGQFEVVQAAEPVYKLLMAGGLAATAMPEPGKLVKSKLGFYWDFTSAQGSIP